MAQTFYRIVKTSAPSEGDFTPRPIRQGTRVDPRVQELASGVSVWATEAQARRMARQFPNLGRYVARLELADDASVRIRKTLGRGHYTIWGESALLQASVVTTITVED